MPRVRKTSQSSPQTILPAFLTVSHRVPYPHYAPGTASLLFSKDLWAHASGQHQSLPPTITLQQQQAQMLSMGYSRVFTLGYLSVAVSPISLRSLSQIH